MPAPTSPSVRVPAAGPDSAYCTIYHRDAGFVALAEAELRAQGGGSAAEPGIWISPAPIRWARCGYGRAGGRQLAAAATLDALAEQLLALRLAAPRFRVACRRIPKSVEGSIAAKTRVADCIAGDVSVDAPDLDLLLVVTAHGYRVLVDTDAAPGDAGWLDVAHRPHNYLVALPVRIAQAMIHLTARAGDTVYDPFCGSGTIPLLAAWAGHRALGSDVSAACVAHAAENAAHFGREVTLACVDARESEQTADCIVSNLPYGVYSHFVPETRRQVLRRIGRLAPRVTLVTSERIEHDLIAEGYAIDQTIAVEAERFERRVYVTRAPAR
jgi:hypothetical protein